MDWIFSCSGGSKFITYCSLKATFTSAGILADAGAKEHDNIKCILQHVFEQVRHNEHILFFVFFFCLKTLTDENRDENIFPFGFESLSGRETEYKIIVLFCIGLFFLLGCRVFVFFGGVLGLGFLFKGFGN